LGTKWHSCRHLDEMLTFDGALWCSPAIDPGLFPLKWPPTPRRRTPASVVARLSGRPRRYRFRGFIRARTRPRSDARPPRGTRSSSGRIGHRIPIRRVGLVLERVTTGRFYGNDFTGGASSEPKPVDVCWLGRLLVSVVRGYAYPASFSFFQSPLAHF